MEFKLKSTARPFQPSLEYRAYYYSPLDSNEAPIYEDMFKGGKTFKIIKELSHDVFSIHVLEAKMTWYVRVASPFMNAGILATWWRVREVRSDQPG